MVTTIVMNILGATNGTDGDSRNKITLHAEVIMQMVYVSIGALGVTGNFLVAFVILYFRSLRRNLTNVFIVNQSLLDFTASVLLITSQLIRDVDVVSGSMAKEIFCRLWLTNLFLWGIFVSSTYNLLALTFERYSAIISPMKHSRRFTRRRAYIIIAIIWVFGPGFNAAYMIPTAAVFDGECTVYSQWGSPVAQRVTGIVTVLLQYFIPITLIIYAYLRIALVLRRAIKNEKIGASNSTNTTSAAAPSVREYRFSSARKNVIKTLAIVSSCFMFCWTWNQIYYTMYNLGYPADFNSSFYHFTVLMVFLNCCINPMVYCLKYKQFQRGFCRIFCGRCWKAGYCGKESGIKSDTDSQLTQSFRKVYNLNGSLSSRSASLTTLANYAVNPTSNTRGKYSFIGNSANKTLTPTKI